MPSHSFGIETIDRHSQHAKPWWIKHPGTLLEKQLVNEIYPTKEWVKINSRIEGLGILVS